MIQQILAAYGLDENQSDIELINSGLINQTWKIKNSRGEFILQRINDNVFKNPPAIAFNLRLLSDFLLEKSPEYLFIAPIKTNENQEMVFLQDKGYFRLFPFIKNSHTIDVVQSPGQALEAAKAFGRFTRLLSGFPVEKLHATLPDFHNLTLRYEQFLAAQEEGNITRIKQSGELIRFIKENKFIVEAYRAILHDPAFKLRVTHHDTKISNVLFNKDDKALGIIDLDTIMPGYFLSDAGDMIRTYLSPVSEEEKDFTKITAREEYFLAIWRGYMSEMNNELTPEEKEHFIYAGKLMIYMQAMRFLTDYLNDDKYYGARYEDHNYVRAGNQAVLLKHLMDKETALRALIERSS